MKQDGRGVGLALCNLVAEPDECVFRTAIAPPTIQRTRYGCGHVETEGRETRHIGTSSRLVTGGWYEECVVGQEQRVFLCCRYRL